MQVHHCFQRVVDLMRDGCGQPADYRELLCLAQTRFRFSLRIDVGIGAEPANDRTCLIPHWQSQGQKHAKFAVGAAQEETSFQTALQT